MLNLALYLAMCCHTVAPQLIKPGMTQKEVEAILGEMGCFSSGSGPLSRQTIVTQYIGHQATIWYQECENGEWVVLSNPHLKELQEKKP